MQQVGVLLCELLEKVLERAMNYGTSVGDFFQHIPNREYGEKDNVTGGKNIVAGRKIA